MKRLINSEVDFGKAVDGSGVKVSAGDMPYGKVGEETVLTRNIECSYIGHAHIGINHSPLETHIVAEPLVGHRPSPCDKCHTPKQGYCNKQFLSHLSEISSKVISPLRFNVSISQR